MAVQAVAVVLVRLAAHHPYRVQVARAATVQLFLELLMAEAVALEAVVQVLLQAELVAVVAVVALLLLFNLPLEQQILAVAVEQFAKAAMVTLMGPQVVQELLWFATRKHRWTNGALGRN